jgi:predicted glycoside hydrolase/deacetylase ChbG (UPF0249 family)
MSMNNFIHADDFGMNDSISKSILDCIQTGSINSVSVMLGGSTKYYQDLIKTGIKIKLHLNLTSNPKIYNSSNKNLMDELTFFKLLYMKKQFREQILGEIRLQIKDFSEFFESERIALDGHHHIQIIPWIYESFSTFEEFDISEVRISKEKIFIDKYSVLLNPRFYRNLTAVLLLKKVCSSIENKYENTPNFYGLLYSGLHSISTIEKFKTIQHDQLSEISFHPGLIEDNDILNMHPKDFNYYSNDYRKTDNKLVSSKELRKLFL